ncbi:hypothetical protein Tco_0930364 [Tanacetum coccineum]
MIDQDKIMVAAGVYYDTTLDRSAHYSDTTYASRAPVEVLGKQTAYTIQSVRHQPGPGHPNTVYYSDSDESDEDEPLEVLEKSSDSTTSHSNHSLPKYESFYFGVDHIEEKSSGSTTSHFDLSFPEYESFHFDLSIDRLPPAERSDLIMRSSPMNSLTSYLHQSMIVFTSILSPIQENYLDF